MNVDNAGYCVDDKAKESFVLKRDARNYSVSRVINREA